MMNKTAKPFGEFGKLATQYDALRPEYPKKIISLIYEAIGVKQPTILDLGCGTGISTRQLAKNKGIIIGVDADKQMLTTASQQARSNILYKHSRAEKLPFENASFDAVTAFTSFHWFMNKKAINEIKRVLKPRGIICIVQPRFASFQKDSCVLLQKNLHCKIPKNYIRSTEMIPLLIKNGFKANKQIVESNIKYTLNHYISLLKTYSWWNYVPILRQKEIEQLLKSHFKTKMKNGYIRNIKNFEVITARKEL